MYEIVVKRCIGGWRDGVWLTLSLARHDDAAEDAEAEGTAPG